MLQNKANRYLAELLEKIVTEGTNSPKLRTYIENEAGEREYLHTKYILNWSEEYDLSKNEVPLIDIRPLSWKKAIGELLWMYQDKSNVVRYTMLGLEDTEANNQLAEEEAEKLGLPISLEGKYGVKWWREWTYQKHVPGTNLIEHSIGSTYGDIIQKYNPLDKVRALMKENPFNRRAISSMWQYDALEYLTIPEAELPKNKRAKLPPCFWGFQLDVRLINQHPQENMRDYSNENCYLDLCLFGRSSDYLMASNQDRIQYTALLYMLAKELYMKPGKLYVHYMNTHIYSNQFVVLDKMKQRLKTRELLQDSKTMEMRLNVPEGTDFYDIKLDDFEIINYDPIKPGIKMQIAI